MIKLPLNLYSGLPMIDLKLWNKTDQIYQSMLVTVDTGASVTTLSKDILHALGYEFANDKKVRITTASGVEYVDSICMEKIKIGKHELTDIEVYGHTFPQESFSSGVIGINILRLFDVTLAFSRDEIIFEPYE